MGYPDGAPPRRSSSSNCLIAALIGCGSLVIVGILAVVFGGYALSKSPAVQQAIKSAGAISTCGPKLAQIGSALQSYRNDHEGKYPAKLSALTPKYLPDESAFNCSAPDGAAGATTYTPPGKNAPEDAPVVTIEMPERTLFATGQ